jgi:putative peptidoglycan lipid II flippase
VLALPIVQLLLQAGKFTSTDAQVTSTILIAYTIGLFAWSAQAIVARGFYSLKDSRTPVIVGTIVTVLFVIGNVIVLRTVGAGGQNGLQAAFGFALVTSLAAILNTGVLVVMLRNRLGGIDGMRLAVGTLKIVAASAVFGVACKGTLAFIQRHPLPAAHLSVKLQSAETLSVCALAGIVAYATMAFVLRMEETKLLMRVVKRKPIAATPQEPTAS